MTSLSFGPSSVDITSYSGDSFKVSYRVMGPDNTSYSMTGSWNMTLYKKSDDSILDTDPTGISLNPIGNGFNNKEFNYTATADQVTFSGADSNGNTLSYVVGTTTVYKNDMLFPSNQYTASTGNSIVFISSSATLNDEIKINCISPITANGAVEVSISNELSELIEQNQTASIVYELYLDNGSDKHTFAIGDISITPRVFE
jgi:hypothetical protein